MKNKNYKSAIHNFAHSLQSIDYTVSPYLVINVLIKLKNQRKPGRLIFNFMDLSIKPVEAASDYSKKIMRDYSNWLPKHIKNHNCDIGLLESLIVEIYTEFEKGITPVGMNDTLEINIVTIAHWKLKDKKEQIVEIKQTELIAKKYLSTGLPDMI